MFEKLDRIDWDQLEHAYGKATDVPEILRNLTSKDSEIRGEAIQCLYSNIWHQGTVYQATAVTIPFLIELLEVPAAQDKHDILFLLREIAKGSSYLDVHGGMDFYHHESRTPEFAVRLNAELGHVRAAREAVVRGAATYLRLMEHNDPQVRSAAAFLLGSCTDFGEATETWLHDYFERESDSMVESCLLLSISSLASQRPTQNRGQQFHLWVALFSRVLKDAASVTLVRLSAGLALLDLGQAELLEDVLATARLAISECDADFSRVPWSEGEGVLVVVDRHLALLPQKRLAWVLENLRHNDPSIRELALYLAENICHEIRSAPRQLAPVIASMADDNNPEVSKSASRHLGTIGSAGIEQLHLLSGHSLPSVRDAADAAIKRAQEIRSLFLGPSRENRPNKPRATGELVSEIHSRRRSRKHEDHRQIRTAVMELGLHGPRAVSSAAVIKDLLDHEATWVRVEAARALWQITGDPAAVLPTLLAELKACQAGFLVLDTLAQMRALAREALPILTTLASSEQRAWRFGVTDEICAADEEFQMACHETIRAIQARTGT